LQVILSKNHAATFNLALEEYLFLESQVDILLFYINQPTVIIGYNQAVENEVNIEFCKSNGISIIRRKSGGGAVYHDYGNLNFSFISNRLATKNVLGKDFLIPIVSVLKQLGVTAEVGQRKDLWLLHAHKISGTASQITKNRELHHGTLLYDANLEWLSSALQVTQKNSTVKATQSVSSPVVNIKDYLLLNNETALPAEVFFEKFVQLAASLFHSVVKTYSQHDISNIQMYEKKYLENCWNLRK